MLLWTFLSYSEYVYLCLSFHTHTHTHTYLHPCTYIMHTYPGMNSAWADNLSPSKCLQQATLYQHQAWVPAAPELCHSMSTTSQAHLEWEVWLCLPLRGGDWMGCQGYSGVFRGCNTLSLDRGSGTGYKAVFSQCQAVFSPSVHFSVCSDQCQLKCSLLLFRRSVASNPLQPHGLQHSRLPCPSPFPRACSNSCPLCQWCHPTISSPVIPFSSCLQSFPASGSFLMSRLFTWSGQNIGASASVSVLQMNIQDWFPL